MSGYMLGGQYLDPDGNPVIATRWPHPDDPNVIGGHASAVAWAGRWIKAASDSQAFLTPDGVNWDHGRTRHEARHGDWIVWTGEAYRVETPESFAAYQPVLIPMDTGAEDTP